MDDIDLAALLVSRVCHDLVSPVGAVVNGLEVLADETDVTMRADALRLVAASAEQASARLQFARLAFGAAGHGRYIHRRAIARFACNPNSPVGA